MHAVDKGKVDGSLREPGDRVVASEEVITGGLDESEFTLELDIDPKVRIYGDGPSPG